MPMYTIEEAIQAADESFGSVFKAIEIICERLEALEKQAGIQPERTFELKRQE